MSTGRPSAEQIRAQEAIKRARNGELVDAKTHKLQQNGSNRYRIGVDPRFCRSLGLSQSDEPESVMMDVKNGLLVIDFGQPLTDGGEE